jgi:hypothetical protein
MYHVKGAHTSTAYAAHCYLKRSLVLKIRGDKTFNTEAINASSAASHAKMQLASNILETASVSINTRKSSQMISYVKTESVSKILDPLSGID